MVKYLKWILPVVAAILTTLIAALSDDTVTTTEWLMVASAAVGTYAGAITPTGSDRESTDGS